MNIREVIQLIPPTARKLGHQIWGLIYRALIGRIGPTIEIRP